MTATGDLLHRFLFENLPVRGHLVRLDASWRAAIEHHEYPEAVSTALGEAMAASTLMAGALKFEGRPLAAVRGSGSGALMLAQCTHRHAIRGVARYDESQLEPPPEGGLLAPASSPSRSSRAKEPIATRAWCRSSCRGFPITSNNTFARSEQLPSRLMLAATPDRTAGLLLQRVALGDAGTAAGIAKADDAWRRIGLLAATVTAGELLDMPCRELLRRLFREDDIRLFEGTPVFFQCSCSRERVAGILQALGGEEVQTLLQERGDVEVRCEFCNRAWRFDAVDVAGNILDGAAQQAPRGLH
jgi:molecular chaperone Hsp33